MIKQSLLLLSITILSASVFAQGIDFFEGSWEEAKETAQSQGKIIFLDAYASWCGPCKRLSKQVFPQEEVGTFFNENFISFKQEMEKGYGPELRKTYPISAFPTLFFIAPTGDVVHKIKGAPRTGQDLINVAMQAKSKWDPSAQYIAQYESGDRSYETMLGYVKSLNKSGESSLRVANEYLEQQEDLTTEQNLVFIYEATTRVDSRIYDYFLAQKAQLKELYGMEEMQEKIYGAASNTVGAAIQFESPELLEEAITKYSAFNPSGSAAFESEARMQFALVSKDSKIYLDNAKTYLKGNTKGVSYYAISQQIFQNFPDDAKAMKSAEKWAAKSTNLDDESDYFLNYAMILQANGKADKAIEASTIAIEQAKKAGLSPEKYIKYKESLQGS